MRLIFASNNSHKIEEIKSILGDKLKKYVYLMSDLGVSIDPDENGKTFEENANIKSMALYEELKNKKLLQDGDFILSDDTGLCIDYLNGEPGIYSARFLGAGVSQEYKNNKILEMLKDAKLDERRAHFITNLSVIEILDANDDKYSLNNFIGRVDGYIAEAIEKTGGFGYDPIFAVGDPQDIVVGKVKTYSNLGIVEKNKISHRAVALRNFVLWLENKHNI